MSSLVLAAHALPTTAAPDDCSRSGRGGVFAPLLERLLAPRLAVRGRTRQASRDVAVHAADHADVLAHTDADPGAADAAARAEEHGADAADVDATLGGDGDAFARIVRRHQDTIARQLHRFTRDRATLEELVQDVFVEAYGGLAGWRRRAPLLHWLRRIAVRVGYRHWTTRARQPDTLDEVAAARLPAPPDREAETREAAEYVAALLQRLAPRDRLVLTLLSVDGCSVAEAADLTGWSRAMVKVQAHRARKRLSMLLRPEETR